MRTSTLSNSSRDLTTELDPGCDQLLRDLQTFTVQLKDARALAAQEKEQSHKIQKLLNETERKLKETSEELAKVTKAMALEQNRAAANTKQLESKFQARLTEIQDRSQKEQSCMEQVLSHTQQELYDVKSETELKKQECQSLKQALDAAESVHQREKELLMLEMESYREELEKLGHAFESMRMEAAIDVVIQNAPCDICENTKNDARAQMARKDEELQIAQRDAKKMREKISDLENKRIQFDRLAETQSLLRNEREKRAALESKILDEIKKIDSSPKSKNRLESFHPDRARLQQDLIAIQEQTWTKGKLV